MELPRFRGRFTAFGLSVLPLSSFQTGQK